MAQTREKIAWTIRDISDLDREILLLAIAKVKYLARSQLN